MTTPTRSAGVALLAGLALGVLIAPGCKRHRRADANVPAAANVVDEETDLAVTLPSGEVTRVKATLTFTDDKARRPLVLLPPGGGNVSRRGTRASDGVKSYAKPIDVTRELSGVLAARGFLVVAWDKRTCGPKDRPECGRYLTADLDAEGPAAMARDVDAACALADTHPLADGRVALWAHGQAGQVVLSSACAKRADATVLVAPIPRSVDRVLVAGIKFRAQGAARYAKTLKGKERTEATQVARDQRNRAASLEETFRAIKHGKFPNDARLFGATLPFWTAWMKLTHEVPGKRPAPEQPWLVALGEHDVQLAPVDQKRIRGWGEISNIDVVEVKGADHHLLVDGSLDADALEPMLEWLTDALFEAPAS